jgi:integrase
MARAWVFQDTRRKEKLGDRAPWFVGWYDPEGKKRSKKLGAKLAAQTYARKLEGQLAAGTYHDPGKKRWGEFIEEYTARILPRLKPRSREQVLLALRRFETVMSPTYVSTIKTTTIDSYVEKRSKDKGVLGAEKVSPATINKELRHLKALLRIGVEWKYLPEMPRFRMVKEPKTLKPYVTPEHFALIYQAGDQAARPDGRDYWAADWWRGLLVFAYMTGWRINEILLLRWDDVSLDKGTAITRAADNKGGRDEAIVLHPVVVEHLRKLIDFDSPLVFFWPNHRRTLWEDFYRLQEAAGIARRAPAPPRAKDAQGGRKRKGPRRKPWEAVPYGFHALRRAFATQNAKRLTPDALQTLMRHKSYSTTQRYINMASQLDDAVAKLHVPDFLKREEE